jgi:hypothetical protein
MEPFVSLATCSLSDCVAGEGRDIELRHQRNPDVVFDCVVTPDGELGAIGAADGLGHRVSRGGGWQKMVVMGWSRKACCLVVPSKDA